MKLDCIRPISYIMAICIQKTTENRHNEVWAPDLASSSECLRHVSFVWLPYMIIIRLE